MDENVIAAKQQQQQQQQRDQSAHITITTYSHIHDTRLY